MRDITKEASMLRVNFDNDFPLAELRQNGHNEVEEITGFASRDVSAGGIAGVFIEWLFPDGEEPWQEQAIAEDQFAGPIRKSLHRHSRGSGNPDRYASSLRSCSYPAPPHRRNCRFLFNP
jgi:hypothetical protein